MSENGQFEEKCDHNEFQRLKFFHGMLLDDKDLNVEQQYHIEKRKLHNRMLHGWGVVCGLDIEWKAGDNSFIVTPGMALDCHGNEIVVCENVTVALNDSTCLSGKTQAAAARQTSRGRHRQTLGNSTTGYIGIRYQETPASPVPVYIPDDECGKQACANSRYREGFCIDILDECPDLKFPGYGNQFEPFACLAEIFNNIGILDKDKEKRENLRALCEYFEMELANICREPLPCPDCCPDPHYVGLGKIEFDDNNCIKTVYLNECRQYVIGHLMNQNSIYGSWCAILKITWELTKARPLVDKENSTVSTTKAKAPRRKSTKKKKASNSKKQQSNEKD